VCACACEVAIGFTFFIEKVALNYLALN
jgi:hypothetical protein